MKTYKVLFQTESRLTIVPDAQVIFGALCNVIKNIYGEEKLMDYFSSFDHSPLFVHSSMFPEAWLPMVKESIFPIDMINDLTLKQENEKQLNLLSKLKIYKKLSFVSESVYRDYLNAGRFDYLKSDILGKEQKFKIESNMLSYANEDIDSTMIRQMTTRVKQDRVDIDDGENRDLFYDIDLFYPKHQLFCIYVKSAQDVEYLERIFKCLSFFPMGNRGSTGKNLFSFVSINEYKIEDVEKEKVILLSKCIPTEDDFDFESSNYELVSRIYKSSNAYYHRVLGRITKFSEGSYMKVQKKKEFYGKIIRLTCDHHDIYHYGIGFTL